MTTTATATVETLTAEVRVLMVGSRQVTMSVYNQLDHADIVEIEWPPFGRVHPRDTAMDTVYVVGRHRGTGALVRCHLVNSDEIRRFGKRCYGHSDYDDYVRESRGPTELVEKLDLYRYVGAPTSLKGHGWGSTEWDAAKAVWDRLANLPLIVLAGLR